LTLLFAAPNFRECLSVTHSKKHSGGIQRRMKAASSRRTPKTPDSPVAAIVLAAGQSSRMGDFKPLLPFGSKTVIDHCLDNLRKAGIETVVVVVGYRADDLKRHLANASIIFALNPDPTSEMSDSIASGLTVLPARTKALVVTPVDHPAVSPEVIASLIHEWERGAPLVVPTWNNRGGHPVLIDLRFRDELLNLDSDRGLKGLFEVHHDQVKRVAVNSIYIARDMDTWDDYRAMHEDLFGVPPPKQPSSAGADREDPGSQETSRETN
jgi:CTP:molybdopterin cytidylyltransferase MocA